MKTTFLVKGSSKQIRVNEKYIALFDAQYLYHTENDFAIVKFNTKKDEKEAFKGIAEHRGEKGFDFYKDTETGVSYIRMDSRVDRDIKAWRNLAQFFNNTAEI